MSISYRFAAVPAGLAALAAITATSAGAAVITVSDLNAPVAAGTWYKFSLDNSVQIVNSYLPGSLAKVTALGHVNTPAPFGTVVNASSFAPAPSPLPKGYLFQTELDSTWTQERIETALGDNLYLPFSFMAGNQTNYGWLDVSIHNPNVPGSVTAAYQVTVNGYGYDDTGASVKVGALASTDATDATSVPEPSSLLLLAAGFAGFSAMRRKSRAAAFTA